MLTLDNKDNNQKKTTPRLYNFVQVLQNNLAIKWWPKALFTTIQISGRRYCIQKLLKRIGKDKRAVLLFTNNQLIVTSNLTKILLENLVVFCNTLYYSFIFISNQ